MVPRPDGSEVMFLGKEERIAKNRFQSFSQPIIFQKILFGLANMVGRTARTLPLAAVSVGRAHRGWQARRDFKGEQA